MTEDESYQEKHDFLIGRIDQLEQILRITISTLTEAQREYICKGAEEIATRKQDIADERNTDVLRDRASAAYEAAEGIRRAIDDWGAHWDDQLGESET